MGPVHRPSLPVAFPHRCRGHRQLCVAVDEQHPRPGGEKGVEGIHACRRLRVRSFIRVVGHSCSYE